MKNLTESTKNDIKIAAQMLTGSKRRAYQAEITQKYFNSSARKAEREMGWGRKTVEKGLGEAKTGLVCKDNYQSRGNKRTEEKIIGIKEDILELAEPHTQADPALQSSLAYTKITAKAIRQGLIDEKGYKEEDLPTENTIGKMLNRFDYTIKRVQKTKPAKKPSYVDEIFENLWEENRKSDENPESLRISIDGKAKLKIGDISRGGKSRKKEAEKASDHDMNVLAKLSPFGILNVLTGALMIIFGTSAETSDFIADCIELWWKSNKSAYTHIKELVINLDNGPSLAGTRTQFIKRMTEFADNTGLKIRLVYYPPYHSKYNSVERCWGILEEHWNGEILNSIDKAVKWAKTMTWKGIKPIVKLWEKVYKKKVFLTKEEMKPYEDRIERSKNLPKWDITIAPLAG